MTKCIEIDSSKLVLSGLKLVMDLSNVHGSADDVHEMQSVEGYTKIERICALSEAARIVTAWSLGELFATAAIRCWEIGSRVSIDEKNSIKLLSITDFPSLKFDAAVASREHVDAFLAVSYAASVACSRAVHGNYEDILLTSFMTDSLDIQHCCASIDKNVAHNMRQSALSEARRVITQYKFLIDDVVSILLRDGYITQEKFLSTVSSHNLSKPQRTPRS